MKQSPATLIQNVYEILGDSEPDRVHWTRRQLCYALNSAFDRLRSMGVVFTFWNNSAVTLANGTGDYTYTHSPSIGTAAVAGIQVVNARLHSDGTYLAKRSIDDLNQMRAGNSSLRGTPTDFAVYRYVTSGVSTSGLDSEVIRVAVFPAPGSANLPESLDLFVSGSEGPVFSNYAEGFNEASATDTVDIPDALVLAVQNYAAGELIAQRTAERLAEIGLSPAAGQVLMRRFEDAASDYVRRLYLDGATDIQLMER